MPKKQSPPPSAVRDINAERDAILGGQINNLTVILQMGAYVPPPNLAQLRAANCAALAFLHSLRSFSAADAHRWCGPDKADCT